MKLNKGQEFYIAEFDETWIFKDRGTFPGGKAYLNFTIKGTKNNMSLYHEDEFEELIKSYEKE